MTGGWRKWHCFTHMKIRYSSLWTTIGNGVYHLFRSIYGEIGDDINFINRMILKLSPINHPQWHCFTHMINWIPNGPAGLFKGSQPPKARRRRQAKAVHAICSDSSLGIREGALDAGSRLAKNLGKCWENLEKHPAERFPLVFPRKIKTHPGNIHSSQWIAGEIPIFPWKNGQITERVPLSQPIETDNARKNIPSKVRITTINMIYHDFKLKHQTQGLDQYNWIQLVEYCVIYPRRHNPHK